MIITCGQVIFRKCAPIAPCALTVMVTLNVTFNLDIVDLSYSCAVIILQIQGISLYQLKQVLSAHVSLIIYRISVFGQRKLTALFPFCRRLEMESYCLCVIVKSVMPVGWHTFSSLLGALLVFSIPGEQSCRKWVLMLQ